MTYASFDYYVSEYLCGIDFKITESEFLFFEKQAEREVDKYTFGRIKGNPALLSCEVKECVCAITELLYEAEMTIRAASEQGLAGPLVSWSNDGNSGAIDITNSIYTEDGKKEKIKSIIHSYLGSTGFLYPGV